jgi:polysaccharide export outer membrane protein
MSNEFGKARQAVSGAVVMSLVIMLTSAYSQTRQQPQVKIPAGTSSEPNETASIVVAPDQDYRIGPRDVIEVRIEDATELSNTYQVNADGTFLMPYLRRIKAQDKTPEELAKFIADSLRDRYLKDPQVLVVVKQYYSHTFFIQGSVRKPGVYQMEGHPSLLTLVTVAGGLAENHGSTAFIIHQVKNKKGDSPANAAMRSAVAAKSDQTPASNEDETAEFILRTVNISGLLKGRFEQNTYVEPGDIVNIPQADVFFVAGEVNAPGSFPLADGTTLRQAIALSQGTTLNAAMGKAVIFRQDLATGKRQEIAVDVGAVMKGEKEDVAILANDIVIVPNSRAKSIGNSILKAFGMSAAQRGLRPY